MKRLHHHGLVAAGLILAGCTTNPPLMFGDNTTFGLRLGNDTATGGASVSLGYKAQSIAIVPVSVLDDQGRPKLLKGHGRDNVDAMSVFASFDSSASTTTSTSKDATVRLGQVFSTGMAAQALTMGYKCRESGDPTCAKTAAAAALEEATSTVKVAAAASTTPASTTAVAARDDGARPYQAPLLFLRNDVAGFDIGGSLAQQGLQFNLGVTNRNLALIPVYAAGANGQVVGITGGGADGQGPNPSRDAMSVLGQFKMNTETTRLDFGLDRYFATGVAARNLGESMQAAIAKAPVQNAAPQTALAAATPAAGAK